MCMTDARQIKHPAATLRAELAATHLQHMCVQTNQVKWKHATAHSVARNLICGSLCIYVFMYACFFFSLCRT